MTEVLPVRRSVLLASALLALFAGLSGTAQASNPAPAPHAKAHAHKDKRVCATTTALTAACDAKVRVDDDGVTPDATTTWGNNGLSPQQLRGAYNAPAASGSPVVAVVDAYANPNAQADLTKYRAQFGLPATTIKQYNQSGSLASSGRVPSGVRSNVGWGQEESLDLDMVSALCPSCQIIYVAASSAGFGDLATAVATAHAKGAKVISNSYGGAEFSTESSYAKYYDYSDAVVTVSSGDSGYGPQFPAADPKVVAVGGTSLTVSSSAPYTRTSESAWSGAGSGCSAYMPKPAWQHDTGCAKRTIADVSAVADPKTGVAVYDSYGSSGGANWYVFGGTSVAAPLVGAYYAASGIPAGTSTTTPPVAITYSKADTTPGTGTIYDVTSGSNGTCATAYLCTSGPGYDGPTGLGTPNNTPTSTGFNTAF
jgi:subtilase family serine protease